MSEKFDPYHEWLGIPASEQPPNHYRLLGTTLFEANLDVLALADVDGDPDVLGCAVQTGRRVEIVLDANAGKTDSPIVPNQVRDVLAQDAAPERLLRDP